MGMEINTIESRVEFVNGEETETPSPGYVACGDGTPYPMLVTLNQVALVYYGISDAWFISGSVEEYYTLTGPPDVTYYSYVNASTTAPTKRAGDLTYRAGIGHTFTRRGYTTQNWGSPTVSNYTGSFLDAAYSAGSSTYSENMYRDINDKEHGIYVKANDPLKRPLWNVEYALEQFASGYVTAFSHRCINTDTVAGSPNSNLFTCQYFVKEEDVDSSWPGIELSGVWFTGKIAVAKDNPLDPMWAPTNRYYLGVTFAIIPTSRDTYVSTDKSLFTTPDNVEFISNYVMRLSETVDITAKLYAKKLDPITTLTGTDFIHKAKTWWKFAKGNPPTDMFDELTGLPL